jgi:hypothetical protein
VACMEKVPFFAIIVDNILNGKISNSKDITIGKAPPVKTEITIDTFKSKVITRTTTFITRKMDSLTLVNQSEGMFVHVKCVSPPTLETWKSPKNAMGMSRKTKVYTIVELLFWISIFFTNITIIPTTRIIFILITECERLFEWFVSCGTR